MWRRPDRAAIEAARQNAEPVVAEGVDLAVRRFLTDTARTARASLGTPALVAAAAPPPVEPITLGTFERFWLAALARSSVEGRIRDTWLAGFRLTSDAQILSTSLDAIPAYMASVSDRLVRGLTPPLPEDAFNHVRVVVTKATSLGWSTTQTAQRIAQELSWETHGSYWRAQLSTTESAISRILDPLGAPGTRAREHARLHDPVVRVLQADRSEIVRKLDAEHSYWQTRAERIARTETTGAYNAGATYALQQERVQRKEWLATHDARTRPEHAAADGQIVPVNHMFQVGGFAAWCPGDPNLPPELSIHCRCAIAGAE